MENVLICVPDGFGYKRLLKRTLDNISKRLNSAHYEIHGDKAGLCKEYFSRSDISAEQINMPLNKTNLQKYSHFIVFWDGSAYTDVIFFGKKNRKMVAIIAIDITTVKNKDLDEKFDVYIGRRTPWGNPFPIVHGDPDNTREVVIEKFRDYFETEILTDPHKLKAILGLRGHALGCHCKPLACHGDVIAEFLNSYEEDIEEAE